MDDKETLKKKIGKAIRCTREQKGISQKQFEAMSSGIDRHTLSKIENARKFPSVYTLYQISVVLDISLSDLLKGIDQP